MYKVSSTGCQWRSFDELDYVELATVDGSWIAWVWFVRAFWLTLYDFSTTWDALNVFDLLEQGFPTFPEPCTPSAFQKMSMYH